MEKAKMIAIYGVNNLGKTTQIAELVKRLKIFGQATSLKYPVYDLEPSGQILFNYLRGGNPFNLTPKEAQIIYVLNRLQFQPKLIKMISKFDFIVLEDYIGTGLAWGIGAGVNKEFLLTLNSCLLTEDIAICLDGQRFLSGKEPGHKHENDNQLTKIVKQVHLNLAKQFEWQVINANQTIEQVGEQIFQIVKEKFRLS